MIIIQLPELTNMKSVSKDTLNSAASRTLTASAAVVETELDRILLELSDEQYKVRLNRKIISTSCSACPETGVRPCFTNVC